MSDEGEADGASGLQEQSAELHVFGHSCLFSLRKCQAAVVKLLKSRLQDEEQMNRAIVALMTAISQKTPLASLGGRLLTSSLLTAALDEIRPLCPFPVCPAMLDMEYSPSLLDQEIQKVLSNVGDPAHVSYTLLFIRLDPSTFTLFKAVLILCSVMSMCSAVNEQLLGRSPRRRRSTWLVTRTCGIFVRCGSTWNSPPASTCGTASR